MVGRVAAAHPAITFLSVAAQDQSSAMQKFVDKYQLNSIPQLVVVWAKFGVLAQPASAFVGTKGSVEVVEGPLSEPELAERVTTLADQ
jgi:hypothetical protein